MKRYRIIVLIALVALMLVVITRFASLRALGDELAGARWGWVAAAAGVHALFLVGYAGLYEIAFAAVGVRAGIRHLLPLVFASFFVNTVLPSGGAAAGALFVSDARRRGQSGPGAAIGVILVLLLDVGTLLPFLGYGLVYLISRGKLTGYEKFGIVSFAVFVLGLLGLLLLARYLPARTRGLLGAFERLANWVGRWVHRPNLVEPSWKEEVSQELAGAVSAGAAHPWLLVAGAAAGVVLHVLNVITLRLLFVAFDHPVGIGPVVVAFGMGIVFFIIGIVPQGLAVVEGVMTLAFTSLGVPGPQAAAVVLVFRSLTYWLPLVAGALFVRRIGESFGGTERGKGH